MSEFEPTADPKPTRKIVAIVGGIASGKSAVRKIFKRLGAEVLDADAIAHEVLERREVASEVAEKLQIQQLFQEHDPVQEHDLAGNPSTGRGLGLAGGAADPLAYAKGHVQVDRRKVAKVVFGDSPEANKALQTLESIVQPRIAQAILEVVHRWRTSSAPAILLLDIPLLFERGWERVCDEVWFVDTPLEMRIRFAGERGWTPEQLAMRERAQMPVEEKRKRADLIVPNDADLDGLERQILLALSRQ